MNIKAYLWEKASDSKRTAMPVLSFPAVQKLNITVTQLVKEADLQAKAIELVAKETPSIAAVSFMDLSVEAEAFGSEVRFSDDEIPTIIGNIIESVEDANALTLPLLGAGRTATYVEAIAKTKKSVTDRPVLAGITGPFTLAGRLFDVNEIMLHCYDDPTPVHTVLEKVTQFLITYGKAFREAGADGLFIAEPLAGLLSPEMESDFSSPYLKKIIEALQSDEFAVIYHNCGSSVIRMLPQIFALGATAYHFGNAVDMRDVMKEAPEDALCMGNLDPAGLFAGESSSEIYQETLALLNDLKEYKNFILSSGCDIPPHAKWENIEAFFSAIEEYNR